MRVEVYQTRGERYRWRAIDRRGKIVALSGDSFGTPSYAWKSFQAFKNAKVRMIGWNE